MSNKVLLLCLILVQFFLTFLAKELLETDEVIYNSLAESLTLVQIEKTLIIKEHWGWLIYLTIPIFLIIKLFLVALITDIGCYFFNEKLRFRKLFNIFIKAEFIFLLVLIFKIFWFLIFQTSYTLNDLQFFYPLSALSIIGHDDLLPWLVYPLQTLNLFELFYWIFVAYLLGKELKLSIDKGLAIVASSYGVSLLIWVLLIMFLTLNIN